MCQQQTYQSSIGENLQSSSFDSSEPITLRRRLPNRSNNDKVTASRSEPCKVNICYFKRKQLQLLRLVNK